ncbi:hypothetical protein IG631_02434 [Alternaria alternata]|nr:hypothetical protein IG631_02434 [Alternaria alternata]
MSYTEPETSFAMTVGLPRIAQPLFWIAPVVWDVPEILRQIKSSLLRLPRLRAE